MKGTFLRDNIEAFAVAIAMALVIRHFCVEAFRIPTGSMMPTLLGDQGPRGERRHGDRILVDKYVWLWRKPRRFEVAVFQYPLNRNKNFIKRIAGLPGEWLKIVDGDLWTSTDKGTTWRIARKSDGARDQLLIPYYPEPVGRPGAFNNQKCWESGTWTIDEKEREFSVEATTEPALMTFSRRILPYDQIDDGYGYSDHPVGDIRLRLDLDVEKAGEFVVHVEEHLRPIRLVLGRADSYVDVEGGKRQVLDFRLEDGGSYSISFANVDDMLYLDLDGEQIEIDYSENDPPDKNIDGWGRHVLRLEARGTKAVVTDITIDRDIAYEERGPSEWKIPEGHYFMLGDNTSSSKDSREWKIVEAHKKDGTILRWEGNPQDGTLNPGGEPGMGPDYQVFVEADINGHTRRFKEGDIQRWETGQHWPFVSADHLIGRAFAVFWPVYLPPVSKHPTRVKLIR